MFYIGNEWCRKRRSEEKLFPLLILSSGHGKRVSGYIPLETIFILSFTSRTEAKCYQVFLSFVYSKSREITEYTVSDNSSSSAFFTY